MKIDRTTRILFVDDEPPVLKALEHLFRPMAAEWEMAFAASGAQALALLEARPFDVVVADMCMPRMSGAQLLNEVMRRHPQTVRIIVSSVVDQELVLKNLGVIHQLLDKPWDLLRLKAMLARVGRLRQRLSDERLRSLVAQMQTFPAVPRVYLRLLEVLQDPGAPITALGAIVAQDPGLTAKLLQLVNSAFFGYARHPETVGEAVQFLGVGVIRSLALGIHVFAAFDRTQVREFPVERIWEHSLQTAELARQVVALEHGDATLGEQAFTAGLLHDAGKLILIANAPADYRLVTDLARARQCPVLAAEREAFGCTHAEVGAYLLGLWGLPLPLVEAVALHHCPDETPDAAFGPLTAVHVANELCHQAEAGDGTGAGFEEGYLERLGLSERRAAWGQLAERFGVGACPTGVATTTSAAPDGRGGSAWMGAGSPGPT